MSDALWTLRAILAVALLAAACWIVGGLIVRVARKAVDAINDLLSAIHGEVGE